MAVAAPDAQEGMFDQEITDVALERQLDDREAKRAAKSEATAKFKDVDEKVKAKLSEFELAVGEVARVGRYRIEKKATKSRSVSFETNPGERLAISLFDGGGD